MAKRPTEFMTKFGVHPDEVWEVRAGGAWAVKHGALERIASEKGILFDAPVLLDHNTEAKIAVMLVTGRMGQGVAEWSIGEAAPYNNKNTYPYAMAEKRAKDRVILKLLNSHGVVFSEAEADEFSERAPHSAQPEPRDEARDLFLASIRKRIGDFVDAAALATWWNSDAEKQARRDFELTPTEVEDLKALVIAKREELTKRKAA